MPKPTTPSLPFEPISEKEMAGHLVGLRLKLTSYAVRSFKVKLEVAEDLVGDAIEKAVKNREKYNPAKGAISTFLYRILRNTYIDYIRTGKARFNNAFLPNEVNDGDNTYTHEPVTEADDFGGNFDQQLILKSISLLPEKYARLIMGLAQGKSYEEMCEEFGKPIGTIKAQVNRGRRILANSLCGSGILDKHDLGRSEYMLDEVSSKEAVVIQHRKDTLKASSHLLGLKEIEVKQPEPEVQFARPNINLNYIKRFKL